jgi:lipopolysaccharide heptosyltransferase II
MKRILVINFTRMGDIVQTSPLIAGLQQKWEQPQIDLLVMRGFRSIARMIPGVSRVMLWDQDESVVRIVRGDSLADTYRYHRDFIESLREHDYDLIINVTHSNESAVLLRALRGKQKRGILLDDLGRKLTSHPWTDYFFNVTANRGFNDFNLVDIYRRIGDLGPGQGDRMQLKVSAEEREKARALLAEFHDGNSSLVAMQPGANSDNRRWPAERFAELADRLYEEYQITPLLIGSADERELTEKISSMAKSPVHNLAGETSIPQLVALLEQCELLISNDTGSMHIAAAVDTPTVALFMATALPQETGAYTEDTIILQPRIDCAPCSHHVVCPHQRCRQMISVSAVLKAIDHMRGKVADFTEEHEVRVFTPAYNQDGMLQLMEISRTTLRIDQLVTSAYRILWKQALDKTPVDAEEEAHFRDVCSTAVPEQLDLLRTQNRPAAPSSIADVLTGYRHTLQQVEELGSRGFEAASMLDSTQDPDRLTRAVEVISTIDGELFQLEMQHTFLRPLCVLYRFNRERMSSDDIGYLAREGRKMYHNVAVRARLLAWLLEILWQELESSTPVSRVVEEVVHA